MKTLYLSDLDGTLLNVNAELSPYTIQNLNSLIDQGVNFTVATARTAATVSGILSHVKINLPVILMNGVLIYDLNQKSYLSINYLQENAIKSILSIHKEYNLNGFMYQVNDDKLSTYYERLTKPLKEFHDERVNKYRKVFTKVTDFSQVNSKDTIYFFYMDAKDKLDLVYDKIKNIPDIATAYYKDVYTTDDIYYLEIFSKKATKYNAAMYLKENFQFDYLIGFGDNLNDLPLFKACNEACAVSNANQEVKLAANHIIDSNRNDGVVRWISKHFNK